MTADPATPAAKPGEIRPEDFVSTPVAGRECGTCTLCCKVYDVPALEKPMGKWCRHCIPGKGCGIHETRPAHCRAFNCLWIITDTLGPEWKPERCKFVITVHPQNRFVLIQVDPGEPAAWKREPYYAAIKRWAQQLVAERRQVIVFVNRRATIVLPDRDTEVGVIEQGDYIEVQRTARPHGDIYEVIRTRPGEAPVRYS